MSQLIGPFANSVQVSHTLGDGGLAATRADRHSKTGHVFLDESGGPPDLQVPRLTNALKSSQSDETILPLLHNWIKETGISFGARVRALHQRLDREQGDRLTRLLGLVASNAPSAARLLLEARFQRPVTQHYRVIAVTPNPAIDAYLATGKLYPGGAGGTLGSILASCGVKTAVCGFLAGGPSGMLYATLAERKGIDTSWLTPIAGDCGFTFFASPGEKLSRYGPKPTRDDRVALVETVRHLIAVADAHEPPLVILSGTVPGVEEEDCKLYFDLIQTIREEQSTRTIKSEIWIDARGPCLYEALKAQPDYVKINAGEFVDLIGRLDAVGLAPTPFRLKSYDRQGLAVGAQALIEHFNIPSMTITNGRDGALQVWRGSNYGLAVHTSGRSRGFIAGLGDTLLAFQAVGKVTGSEFASRIEFGVAAALVSSRKEGTDLAENLQEVEPFMRHVRRELLVVAGDVGRPTTIERFLGALQKRGAKPVIAADMDGTITVGQEPVSDEVANSVLAVLRSGITFAILTSSSIGAVNRQVVSALRSKADAVDLANLYALVSQGGEGYHYNALSGSFELSFSADLRNPSILGPARLRDLKMVIQETVGQFKIPGTVDEVIDDRTSQITLLALGRGASNQQKDEYERNGGRTRRKEIAAFMNGRFKQLRLNVFARVAGRSSIDITPRNIDKGFGIGRLAEMLNVDPSTVLFIGNEFDAQGSDLPAARKAGLALNVGYSTLRQGVSRAFVVESRKLGPSGVLRVFSHVLSVQRRARAV